MNCGKNQVSVLTIISRTAKTILVLAYLSIKIEGKGAQKHENLRVNQTLQNFCTEPDSMRLFNFDLVIVYVLFVPSFLRECYNHKKFRLFVDFSIGFPCEIENSNEGTGFEMISAGNRLSIAFYGLKYFVIKNQIQKQLYLIV